LTSIANRPHALLPILITVTDYLNATDGIRKRKLVMKKQEELDRKEAERLFVIAGLWR
jgi:hypothetical protein